MPMSYAPMTGHIYSTPSHVANMRPKSYLSTFFMPDDLRKDYLMKNEISNTIEHDSSNLPLEVDNYHNLSLLEAPSNLPSTTTYKATHNATGIKYCLKRLHGKNF